MWGSQAAQAKASVILQTPNHGAQAPGAGAGHPPQSQGPRSQALPTCCEVKETRSVLLLSV